MIPERYLNFLLEIPRKFPIGNLGKLPRSIPKYTRYIYSLQRVIEGKSRRGRDHNLKAIKFDRILTDAYNTSA